MRRDREEAVRLFRLAAEQGEPSAQTNLGGMSVTVVAAAAPAPDVAPVDVEQLDVAQLRLLAEQGDARAQTEFGERYEEGRGGVVQNYEAAVALYRRAAEQGDVRGQGNLGAMYSNGWGVPQDKEVAVMRPPWIRQGTRYQKATASPPNTPAEPVVDTEAKDN